MHIMLNIIKFGTHGKKTKHVFDIQRVGSIIIYRNLSLLFYQYPSLYLGTWPSCIFQTRKWLVKKSTILKYICLNVNILTMSKCKLEIINPLN
jgi:hypothetical protein